MDAGQASRVGSVLYTDPAQNIVYPTAALRTRPLSPARCIPADRAAPGRPILVTSYFFRTLFFLLQ